VEDIGIFYGHLVYFTVIRYSIWTFGTFSGNLVYFSPCWYLCQEKSGNPGPARSTLKMGQSHLAR
jgi:hypothetical protein